MILDLHLHSVFSVDSPIKPEQYAQRALELRDQGYRIDGFVLTEHNFLVTPGKCDLDALGRERDLVVLAGVEVDTYWGHILVYGMDERLWAELDGDKVRKHEPVRMARFLAEQEGVVLVPSHPFRHMFGLRERSLELDGVAAIEGINGANEPDENRLALNFARKHKIPITGGSDSHFLPELGKAMTRFEQPVQTISDLVRQIKAGQIQAVELENTREK